MGSKPAQTTLVIASFCVIRLFKLPLALTWFYCMDEFNKMLIKFLGK